MTEETTQTFCLSNGSVEHIIEVAVECIRDGFQVVGRYCHGSLDLEPRTVIATWPVRFEFANDFDEGYVAIGSGRIEIEIPELRRLGLGSLFMGILIKRIKAQPSLPVATIDLKGDDATTSETKESRNRFYERFGFTFQYKGERTWGSSHPMHSAALLEPAPTVRTGWKLQEL